MAEVKLMTSLKEINVLVVIDTEYSRVVADRCRFDVSFPLLAVTRIRLRPPRCTHLPCLIDSWSSVFLAAHRECGNVEEAGALNGRRAEKKCQRRAHQLGRLRQCEVLLAGIAANSKGLIVTHSSPLSSRAIGFFWCTSLFRCEVL